MKWPALTTAGAVVLACGAVLAIAGAQGSNGVGVVAASLILLCWYELRRLVTAVDALSKQLARLADLPPPQVPMPRPSPLRGSESPEKGD